MDFLRIVRDEVSQALGRVSYKKKVTSVSYKVAKKKRL